MYVHLSHFQHFGCPGGPRACFNRGHMLTSEQCACLERLVSAGRSLRHAAKRARLSYATAKRWKARWAFRRQAAGQALESPFCVASARISSLGAVGAQIRIPQCFVQFVHSRHEVKIWAGLDLEMPHTIVLKILRALVKGCRVSSPRE